VEIKSVIVGLGDIGLRIAYRIKLQTGQAALGLCRRPEKAADYTHVVARQMDLDAAEVGAADYTGKAVYYLAPPPTTGDSDPRMAAWLRGIPLTGLPLKIVLISTTGVYGDCEGEWIDERQPLNPQTDRARRRVDAEQQLQQWADPLGVEWLILRVAGIYGPWRLPLERLRQGMTILAEADSGYSNRIHADDLAAACVAAMYGGDNRQVINATDGHPSSMGDYFRQVAREYGLAAPAEVDWAQAQQQMSAEMLSYLRESKRIDNQRLLALPGFTLMYPDLKSGLHACRLAEGDY